MTKLKFLIAAWLIKPGLFVALAATLVAGAAFADLVAVDSEGNEMRLFSKPCTNPAILDALNPDYHAKFSAGQAIVSGRLINLCWIDTEQGAIYVQPEGGQGMAFPDAIFTDKPGV